MYRNLERIFRFVLYIYLGTTVFLHIQPKLVFPYKIPHDTYSLFGSVPFETHAVQLTLDRTLDKINSSILPADFENIEIYFSHDHLHFRSVVNWSRKATGYYNSLTGNIFLNKLDFEQNKIWNSIDSAQPRVLSEVLAHELTHATLKKRVGLWRIMTISGWKIEGLCEYVAKGSSLDNRAEIEAFLAQAELEGRSLKYLKYRMYVSYLIEAKKYSIDELLASEYNQDDLNQEVTAYFESLSKSM